MINCISAPLLNEKFSDRPTVLRIGAYRFFFYANENSEPHHIHVQRERDVAHPRIMLRCERIAERMTSPP